MWNVGESALATFTSIESSVREEVKRGLTESLGLKLWWVLATLAQALEQGPGPHKKR